MAVITNTEHQQNRHTLCSAYRNSHGKYTIYLQSCTDFRKFREHTNSKL